MCASLLSCDYSIHTHTHTHTLSLSLAYSAVGARPGNIELAWESLKSLCIAPPDVQTTFAKVARPIGECIQNESETLRARACSALTTLCRFCMSKRREEEDHDQDNNNNSGNKTVRNAVLMTMIPAIHPSS